MPLIQPYLSTNVSPPLISHFHRFRRAAESDSFPPGEAKGGNQKLSPFNEPLSSVSFGRLVAVPTECVQKSSCLYLFIDFCEHMWYNIFI